MSIPAQEDKSFKLADIPKDKEYEEYISAYLQCDGYYVERNIIAREKKELLELDILITKYGQDVPKPKLVEIKSGGWGPSDAFKLRGWIDFLKDVDEGILIAQNNVEEIDYYKKNFRDLNIDIIINEDLQKTKECLAGLLGEKTPTEADLDWWRFSYWMERKLLSWLKKQKNFYYSENKQEGAKATERYEVLDRYYFKVNSSIFFTTNILDKLYALYTLYQTYPRLSARCGNEMRGGSFNDDVSTLHRDLFSQTYYDCELNDVAMSTFVEYISRLAILKCAVDYIIFKKEGVEERVKGMQFLGIDMSFISLPNYFKDAIGELSQQPYFHLYPVFWQWFVYIFGGFIMLDMKEQEYQLLSDKTGIPVDQIDNALGAFSTLFPVQGGWFFTNTNNNFRMLKMFSLPFASIGANYRKSIYTKGNDYEEFNGILKGRYSIHDLYMYHSVGYDLLSKKL